MSISPSQAQRRKTGLQFQWLESTLIHQPVQVSGFSQRNGSNMVFCWDAAVTPPKMKHPTSKTGKKCVWDAAPSLRMVARSIFDKMLDFILVVTNDCILVVTNDCIPAHINQLPTTCLKPSPRS